MTVCFNNRYFPVTIQAVRYVTQLIKKKDSDKPANRTRGFRQMKLLLRSITIKLLLRILSDEAD